MAGQGGRAGGAQPTAAAASAADGLAAALEVLRGDATLDPLQAVAPPGMRYVLACGADGCGVTNDTAPLKSCAACRQVCYCGAACQRADWRRHKPECRASVAAVKALAEAGVTYLQRKPTKRQMDERRV